MSFNRELFKNKILYRASYRGTKEMDKLMQGFVRSIIDKLDENDLEVLNEFVNMDGIFLDFCFDQIDTDPCWSDRLTTNLS